MINKKNKTFSVDTKKLINRILINNKLLCLYKNFEKVYGENHRYFHSYVHIDELLSSISLLYKERKINWNECELLCFAALYHDYVYNIDYPINNEINSARIFNEQCLILPLEKKEIITQIIVDTKHHDLKNIKNKLSQIFCRLDMGSLLGSLSEMIKKEQLLFKEYQKFSYDEYLKGRIDFLTNLINNDYENSETIKQFIEYLKSRTINVGLYAGSFNPFHIGHLNVLEKAEKIFDKVIILFGYNPDKKQPNLKKVPLTISNRQIVHYDGLMVHYIKKNTTSNQKITLIRGLRNSNDFNNEQITTKYNQELYPNVDIVYIPCDVEYQHISSSSINTLKQFENSKFEKYIVD